MRVIETFEEAEELLAVANDETVYAIYKAYDELMCRPLHLITTGTYLGLKRKSYGDVLLVAVRLKDNG